MATGTPLQPGRAPLRLWMVLGFGVCLVGGASSVGLIALLLLAQDRTPLRVAPPPPLPSPNAVDFYTAAAKAYRANGGEDRVAAVIKALGADHHTPSATQAPALLAAKTAVVERNGEALRVLHQGLRCEGAVRLPSDVRARITWGKDVRLLARLLSYDQAVRSSAGDYAGVCDDAADALRMGRHVERGGGLMGGLIGMVCDEIVRAQAVDAVDRLTAGQCDAVRARIERELRLEPSISASLLEERDCMLRQAVGEMDAHPESSVDFEDEPSGGAVSRGVTRAIGTAVWRAQRRAFIADTNRYFQSLAAQADLPVSQQLPAARPRSSLAEELTPDLALYVRKRKIDQARNRMLVCALAVRAHQLRQGALPASLTDLRLDPLFTTDPFSGGTLIYRREAGSYVLYSVGHDLVDSRGVPVDEGLGDKGQGDLGLRRYSDPRHQQSPNNSTPVPHMRSPAGGR